MCVKFACALRAKEDWGEEAGVSYAKTGFATPLVGARRR
jgi:hypothetical protein